MSDEEKAKHKAYTKQQLKGKNICGLHIWSNLQVIPKIQNLQKGNKEMTKFPT